MRVVFAIVAISILSTSAHARECYKLSWAERGECHRTDPTYPVRYDMCLNLVHEQGYNGPAFSSKTNMGMRESFNQCMHKLSPLGMQELARLGPSLARTPSQRHYVTAGWGAD
jgi:hypothetical protein